MSRPIKLIMLASILVLFCHPVHAQIINAASCSSSDVSNALAAVNQATATVTIPAGTCHWGNGSAFTFNIPSITTTLTIQGQTACTGSGDPAQNNLVCTDGTTIVDDDTTSTGQDASSLIQINLNSNSASLFRLTGITLNAGANTNTNNAVIIIGGSGGGQSIRVDHNHFNMDTFTGGTAQIDPLQVGGCSWGVADHNIFDSNSTVRTNSIVIDSGESCNGDPNSKGNGTWALPTQYGSNQFFFVEQNRFNFSVHGSQAANDCVVGGKYVWRYNTMYNEAHVQTHPTGSAMNERSRAQEIYKNNWIFNQGTNFVFNIFFDSGGGALIWGNSVPSGYQNWVTLHECRATTNCGYGEQPTPNEWGFCNGTSAWDQNSTSSGYACIDQPGRGQGDLLSGLFPNTINTVTKSIAWPHQALEPIYFWLNSFVPLGNGNGNTVPFTIDDAGFFTQNVDYYVSSDQNSGTDCNGFTGATGVGCGQLSSRPSTCTPRVGYWGTDTNTLYLCETSNAWTAYYTPYTYPHPLTTSSGVAPTPPTNLQVTVN